MPVGVRHLKVLGEFKPFGLVAEALDGKTPSNDVYDYFIFGPELAAQRDAGEVLDASLLSDRSDHELFISGNRITWTTGSRVHKRFTLPSPVIMACWSRLGILMEPFLCVLQIDSLTIFSISGEESSLPLPHAITSIWPLPFGLLLQQDAEGSSQNLPFPCARETSRGKREFRYSPRHSSAVAWALDNVITGYRDPVSSHLILKDPLEEPQSTFIEERGKFNIMKEFDEKTIWTSSVVPLMASYNKGKMQHSLWVAESIGPDHEVANAKLSEALPIGVFQKQISFRRIWQGKGAQTAASKVFLATDDDAAPIICFLLQEQKKLLILWFHTTEINSEIIFDIKPDMSWSIPAIAAEPVIVTRPCAKPGQLAFGDIIVLASENTLLLYSGKQCLCRYILPPGLGSERVSKNVIPMETTSSHCDLKIVGLSDAVDGRVNVIMNNGQILRCVLRRSPSSSLANDCLTVMADGLSFSFYTYFLALLWGDSAYLSEEDASIDSEWESYSSIILQMCKKYKTGAKSFSSSTSQSSWDFLVNSDFHKNYCNASSIGGDSTVMTLDLQQSDSRGLYNDIIQSPDESFNYEILAQILETLHAVYESMKLDNRRKRDLGLLVILLCNIADYLGEVNYLDHYVRDFPGLSKKFEVRASSSGRHPPSLFRWIESSLLYGCNVADTNDLPPLIRKDECSVLSWARKIVSFYSLLCGAKPSGKNLSSGVSCKISSGSSSNSEELTVLAMVGEQFGLPQLDLLPAGVSLPLRHALDNCRESPPTDWPAAAYILLGREDLGLSHANKLKELEVQSNLKLISMSTPYMLHLHPVAVPSSFLDTNGPENTKFEDADCVDGSMVDGMEHIFNSNMQLQYGRDLRLNEVRRLLCSAKPVAIQTSDNPTASDQDLQQAQLWQLAQRTTALPLGRGAFTLATTSTLLTEAFTVPKLVLAGRLPAQQNATVNLDPSIRNIPELKSWPEFHNAVAAGLRLSHLQGKISRTWIMYNKPEAPNVVHAGLLLSLGLHRHLHVLTITDIYQYLAQEHENTTVGLMLGLAASYRGTMQPAISKCLYVHIPARHPSNFPELELPTLMQSAALMSVGLLYEGSAHPQTMQNLLAEIGRRSGGDNVLEREGYAVSAGFSLGLVALGRGEDALGFMDTFVERLFQYVGGKASHNERSLPLNVSADDHHRGVGQMMDGTLVNVDVTAPGAIIALALMFLKTESELAISRLSIPSTHFELQYVRPDFIMLRVIARNLIMWKRVHASKEWINSQIPEVVQNGIRGLGDEEGDIDEIDVEAVVQAYVNILAGSCISIGLRFAGTKDGRAQELLYEYALYFMNEIKAVSARTGNTFPKGLSHYVDRGTLEVCLHLIVLSLSVVMAGSGNLKTFRLLRFLRSRNSADGHVNYGTQMAVSLAIGFLFLGGGMRTFSTSNSSIAALLITLYPRLPTGPNDNRCHLQAFRHLYVLATEARWIQTVDVDSGLPVYAPLEVTLKETENYGETDFLQVTPCILPERVALKTVRVCGPRYWPQVIDLVPEDKPWWGLGDNNDPFNSGVLYIKRKVGACSYVDDPIGCQSLLSRAMHKVFGLTSLKACAPSTSDPIGASPVTIDQLVSTFSSDPSLIAFAQLCCDPAWNSRSDPDFQEFCLQVLFECVSKDRPALLQVYLSLYTTLQCMAVEVAGGSSSLRDTFFISSLKLALAYNEALARGRMANTRGGIVQSAFLGSLKKRVEELLRVSPDLHKSFQFYLKSGRWVDEQGNGSVVLLSWYLQWYSVPSPSAIGKALDKMKLLLIPSSSAVPILRLLMPTTHISAIEQIQKGLFSS